ncbi:MAG: metal-dependent transcriptional regulator [Candidatus Bathyarchaeia archaeon]
MTVELSYEAEEYIEAIYKLQKKSGAARTKELAKELNVVPGSITNTIAHLEKHGLVEHTPYKGVKLTAEGERLALNIIRRHRLAERLLTDLLEADWSHVHETACRLEHALTEDVLSLLEKRLGYPKFCPHGNPIPTENGEVSDVECYPLTSMAVNQTCIIVKLLDERRETLLSLADKGMKPNVPIHIVKIEGDNLVVCVAGREQTLSLKEAEDVWVKAIEVKENNVWKKTPQAY